MNTIMNQKFISKNFGISPEKEARRKQKEAEADKAIAEFKAELEKNGLRTKFTPKEKAVASGLSMFIIGFGSDRLLGKCIPSLKTNMKLSLGLNAAFGLGSGIFTYFKAKKEDAQK